jgi:hypothetical protein
LNTKCEEDEVKLIQSNDQLDCQRNCFENFHKNLAATSKNKKKIEFAIKDKSALVNNLNKTLHTAKDKALIYNETIRLLKESIENKNNKFKSTIKALGIFFVN